MNTRRTQSQVSPVVSFCRCPPTPSRLPFSSPPSWVLQIVVLVLYCSCFSTALRITAGLETSRLALFELYGMRCVSSLSSEASA